MAQKAREFNLGVSIVSTNLYDEEEKAAKKLFLAKKDNTVVLAAGEPRIVVLKKGGKGGRNIYMGLEVLKDEMANEKNLTNSVFISFASDGIDNSDMAGAIVDEKTKEKAEKSGLEAGKYLADFDSYTFFQNTGDLINTGPTGANVSDLIILLNKK
jgi:glycerate-2-kinase